MDVAFLLDSSKSITGASFKEMKNFVQAAISSLKIAPTKTHVSVANFGNTVNTAIDFSLGRQESTVLEKLRSTVKVGGERDLRKSLDYVNNNLFTTSSGSRNEAEKTLVIITGNEINPTRDANFIMSARKLKSRNINIIVVGMNIEKDVVTELSIPNDLVTVIKSFKELPEVLGQVEKDMRGKG